MGTFETLSSLKILNTSGELFKTNELCDYVVSIGVIHHIKNPIDVFRNIRKNLKDDGKLVILHDDGTWEYKIVEEVDVSSLNVDCKYWKNEVEQ